MEVISELWRFFASAQETMAFADHRHDAHSGRPHDRHPRLGGGPLHLYDLLSTREARSRADPRFGAEGP